MKGMPFNSRDKKDGVQFVKYGQLANYKFYLAFENSIHCNDYIKGIHHLVFYLRFEPRGPEIKHSTESVVESVLNRL